MTIPTYDKLLQPTLTALDDLGGTGSIARINELVLDQLCGSLCRFDAVSGTVITTGRFSRRSEQTVFERDAVPITMIDGEKPLDLLMEYQIGVAKKSVDYLESDSGKLVQFEDSLKSEV